MKLESFTGTSWDRDPDRDGFEDVRDPNGREFAGLDDVFHPNGTKGGVFCPPGSQGEVPLQRELFTVAPDDPGAFGGPQETQVRIEHCGRRYVFELSRWEWLSVAIGRTPPTQTMCLLCREDIALPLSREDGRSVLRGAARFSWSRLSFVVKAGWWRLFLRSFLGAGMGGALVWVASPEPRLRAVLGMAFLLSCVVHFDRFARWMLLGSVWGFAGSALASVWWQFGLRWGAMVGMAVGCLAGALGFAVHALWRRRLARREAALQVLGDR